MPNDLYAKVDKSGRPEPKFNSNWVTDVESPDMREAVYQRVTVPNEERARQVARAAGANRPTSRPAPRKSGRQ
jgi:hypothetical protein